MARERFYNQKGASCVINGTQIQDFSDGESIRVVRGGDKSSLTKGTDGAAQNIINDPTGSFEIDLKETSPSNSFLANLLATQEGGNFLDVAGAVIDGAGARHGGTGGLVKQGAGVSTGGPAMGKRTWIVEFTTLQTDR